MFSSVSDREFIPHALMFRNLRKAPLNFAAAVFPIGGALAGASIQ